MAKYKIFIDVSNQIRDENKTNFIIDANCSLIEHLDLGWREGDIDFIEPNALRNFISLKSLDLKNNLIKSIDHECFENLTNLEELNLSGNYLKKLPVNFFSTMHKLKCWNLDELSQKIDSPMIKFGNGGVLVHPSTAEFEKSSSKRHDTVSASGKS